MKDGKMTTVKKIFTVRDTKAEAYMDPFYMASRGEAVRSFGDAANDTQHPFHKHPEDYVLFELGEYDLGSASFHLHEAPKSLGVALDFVVKDKS